MNKDEIKLEVKRIQNQIKKEIRSTKGIRKKLELRSEVYKLFDEIYEKYGQEAYCKFVPKKYRKQDERDLLDEGRYISLLNKHGEKIFNNYMTEIRMCDMDYESGSKIKIGLYWVRRKFQNIILPGILSFLIAGGAAIQHVVDQNIKDEAMEYAPQIELYLDKVATYGEEIRKLNLSDIQNIMIATSDMWEHIEGYKNPKIDLTACPGLDLASEDGYGVCRNMADDIARKLNAIDPKYNARVINVYMESGSIDLADIDRTVVTNSDTVEEPETTENYYDFSDATEASINVGGEDTEQIESDDVHIVDPTEAIVDESKENIEYETAGSSEDPEATGVETENADKISEWMDNNEDFIRYYVGNHAVVVLDSREDNLELVVDPTNPSMGMIQNGKIIMFNAYGDEPFKLYYRPASSFIYGTEKLIEIPENYLKSTVIYSKSKMEYFMNKYGVDAQNEAIEQAQKYKQKSYAESLKVDAKDINNDYRENTRSEEKNPYINEEERD